MDEELERIPLRELCREAERLTRELVDHLERNLLPRTRETYELVRPDSPFAAEGQVVADISIRNQVAVLLESQQFTEDLFLRTNRYLREVDRQLEAMIGRK